LEKSKAIKKLTSLRGLDGYSDKLIIKAIDLVKELVPAPIVFPTNRNSIQFEWERGILYLELEVYEDRIEVFNQASDRWGNTIIGSIS
jgi:hypothetical protein